MDPAYFVVVVAVALACAPVLSSRTTRQRERALERYCRRMNLTLPPEVRPRVVRRIRAHEWAMLVGGTVGALVGFGVGLALPPAPDSGTWLPLAVFAGAGLGGSLAAVASATALTLRAGPGPRIARPLAPTLVDYVPALERWLPPVALGCAGLALLGGIVALGTGVLHGDGLTAGALLRSAGAVLGYLALAGQVTARLLGRRILSSGQPAASPHELAWDDALRAAALRGLLVPPGLLACASVLMTFLGLGAGAEDPPVLVGLIGGAALIGFTCAVGAVLLAGALSRPSQHYWRRLWRSDPASSAAR